MQMSPNRRSVTDLMDGCPGWVRLTFFAGQLCGLSCLFGCSYSLRRQVIPHLELAGKKKLPYGVWLGRLSIGAYYIYLYPTFQTVRIGGGAEGDILF